ncbi:MAG: tandem-95 repeat protein [Planctomycetaceae bacterium]|nr:tandem-95 repeat protein [Planctomycetaceae bacterium]
MIENLELINDTDTPDDLSTSDPRIGFTLTDVNPSYYYDLQFDTNGDGNADFTSYAYGTGTYEQNLGEYLGYGTYTIGVRAVEYPDSGAPSVASAWSSLTFTYAPPYSEPPVISSLGLVNDTDTPGDLSTSDPRIGFTLSDSTPGYYYELQFDINGDGYSDLSSDAYGPGSYQQNLSGYLGYGEQTVSVRAIVYRDMAPSATGAWVSLTFTLAPPHNDPPVIENLGLVSDPDADLSTSDPRISFMLSDPNPSYYYYLEVDTNGDGSADLTDSAYGPGNSQQDLSGYLGYGTHTIAVRAIEYPESGAPSVASAWTSLTFTYAPPPNDPPVIANLGLVNDPDADLSTSDPRIGFTLMDVNPSYYYDLQFDTNGDGSADFTNSAYGTGTYEQNLGEYLGYGTYTISIRAIEYPDMAPSVTGEWTSLTFTYAPSSNAAPTLSGLGLVNGTTDSEGGLFTEDGLLTFSIDDADGDMVTSYLVELDPYGEGMSSSWSVSGTGTHQLNLTSDPLYLGYGSYPFRMRVREYDGEMSGDPSEWTSLTFTYAEPNSEPPPPNAPPVIANLVLVNDPDSDLNTSDPRISFVLNDADPSYYYALEIDTNGDGYADLSESASGPGTYQQDLSGYLGYGTHTISVRAIEYPDMAPSVTGAWVALTFTYAAPYNATPTLSGLGLVNGTTDSEGGLVTEDGLITFSIDDADGDMMTSYLVELDPLGDGMSTSWWVSGTGVHQLNLKSEPTYLADGSYPFRMRIREYDGEQSGEASEWSSLTFTLGPLDTAPPVISGLAQVSETRITFTLNSIESGSYYLIEFDTNGDGSAEASTSIYEAGTYEQDLSGYLGNGETTVAIRSTEYWDMTPMVISSWTTLTLTFEPVVSAPIISHLELVHDSDTPGDWITSDARIRVTLTDPEPGFLYDIEFDTNGDGMADTSLDVTEPGTYEFDLEGYLGYGQHTVFVRATRYQSGAPESYSNWDALTFTLTVPSNSPPVANPDSVSVVTGETVLVDVLLNDLDPEGANIRLIGVGTASSGSVLLKPRIDATYWNEWLSLGQTMYPTFAEWWDASYSNELGPASALAYDVEYTAAPEFAGTVQVTYTIADSAGAVTEGMVTFEVTPPAVNQAPVAASDSVSALPEESITIRVLSNDSDPDGDALAISSVSTPAHGTVTVQYSTEFGEDVLVYTAGIAGFGEDSFTYVITDPDGQTATATVTINEAIPIPNTPPVLQADVRSVNEYSLLILTPLANDLDADGDTLEIVSVTQPVAGGTTKILKANSVYTQDRILFTPDRTIYGDVTFTYSVSDGEAIETATITVSVIRSALNNSAPVTKSDQIWAALGETVFIPVLQNDSDADDTELTLTGIQNVLHGSATITTGTITYEQGATVTVQGISYTAHAAFFADDQFTYTIADSLGATATGNVTVYVYDPAAAPPAVTDDVVSLYQGQSIDIDVLANDVSGLLLGSLDEVGVGSAEVVIEDSHPILRYTAPTDVIGDQQLTYWVKDPSTGGRTSGLVTVTIEELALPDLVTDEVTVIAGSSTLFDPLANDTDPFGGSLQLVGIGSGEHAPQSGQALLEVGTDGITRIRYFANLGAWQSDEFTYLVRDDFGRIVEGTVQVTISTLQDLDLWLDTEIPGDRITNNPTLIGHVSGMQDISETVPAPPSVLVEFDLDGDGLADDSLTVTIDFADDIVAFAYTPTGLGYGEHVVAARTTVIHPVTSESIQSDWMTTTFTLAPAVAPRIATFSEYVPTYDESGSETGTAEEFVPQLRLAGTLSGAAAFERVEFDHDGDGQVDGDTYSDGEGRFTYDPTGLPEGTSLIRARSAVLDRVTGETVVSEWAEFAVTVDLIDPPLVAALWLATDVQNANGVTWSSSRPQIQGSLASGTYDYDEFTGEPIGATFGASNPISIPAAVDYSLLTPETINPLLARVLIEFDHDGDGVVDGKTWSDVAGRFSYYAVGLTVGTQAIRARTVVVDPEQGTSVTSEWSTIEFELLDRGPLAAVDTNTLSLATTGTNGQPTAPQFVGTLTGERKAGAIVEFSNDGVNVDFRVLTDANGTFTYTPPALAYGDVTAYFRTQTYDSVAHANVTSGWVSFTTNYAPPAHSIYLLDTTGSSTSGESGTSASSDPGSEITDVTYTDAITAAQTAYNNTVATANSTLATALAPINQAYNSAVADADAALASALANSSFDTTQLSVNLDWQPVNVSLQLAEPPLPPVPLTRADQAVSANLPDLDLENDPLYQQQFQEAESQYQQDTAQALNDFKAAMGPAYDTLLKAVNKASKNKSDAEKQAKNALDLAKAAAESLFVLQTSLSNAAYDLKYNPSIADATAQMEALVALLNLWTEDNYPLYQVQPPAHEKWMEDRQQAIASWYDIVNSGLDNEAIVQAAEEMIAVYHAIDMEYFIAVVETGSEMTLQYAAAEKNYRAGTAALQFQVDSATANRDRDKAIAAAERGFLRDSVIAAAEARYMTALTNAAFKFAEEIATPSATYSATLQMELAKYNVSVAQAEAARTESQLTRMQERLDAWAAANPGALADYLAGTDGAFAKNSATVLAANSDQIAYLETVQTQMAASSQAVATAHANQIKADTKSSKDFSLGIISAWKDYNKQIRESERDAAKSKAEAEATKAIAFATFRRDYTIAEAEAKQSFISDFVDLTKAYRNESATNWSDNRRVSYLSDQVWEVVSPKAGHITGYVPGHYFVLPGVGSLVNGPLNRIDFTTLLPWESSWFEISSSGYDESVTWPADDPTAWREAQLELDLEYQANYGLERLIHLSNHADNLAEWASGRVAATAAYYTTVATADAALATKKATALKTFQTAVAEKSSTYEEETFAHAKAYADAVNTAEQALANTSITAAEQSEKAAADRQSALQVGLAAAQTAFTSAITGEFTSTLANWAGGLASAAYAAFVNTTATASATQDVAAAEAAEANAVATASINAQNVKTLAENAAAADRADVAAAKAQQNGYIAAAEAATTKQIAAGFSFATQIATAISTQTVDDTASNLAYELALIAQKAALQNAVDQAEWNRIKADAEAEYYWWADAVSDEQLNNIKLGNQTLRDQAWVVAQVAYNSSAVVKYSENAKAKVEHANAASNTVTGANGDLTKNVAQASIDYAKDVNAADSGFINATLANAQGYTTGQLSTMQGWEDALANQDMAFINGLATASDAYQSTMIQSSLAFQSGRADERLTQMQDWFGTVTGANGNPAQTSIEQMEYTSGYEEGMGEYSNQLTSAGTVNITPELAQLLLDQATADRNYIVDRTAATASLYGGGTAGGGLLGASSTLRSSLLAESVAADSAIRGASYGYNTSLVNHLFNTEIASNTASAALTSSLLAASGERAVRDIDQRVSAYQQASQANLAAANTSVDQVSSWMTSSNQAYQAAADAGAFFNIYASPYNSGTNPILQPRATPQTTQEVADPTAPDLSHLTGAGGLVTWQDSSQVTNYQDQLNTHKSSLLGNLNTSRVSSLTGLGTIQAGMAGQLNTSRQQFNASSQSAYTAYYDAMDALPQFNSPDEVTGKTPTQTFLEQNSTAQRNLVVNSLTHQQTYLTSLTSLVQSYEQSTAASATTHTTAYAQALATYQESTQLREYNAAQAIANSSGLAADQQAAAVAHARYIYTQQFAANFVNYITATAQAEAAFQSAQVAAQNALALAQASESISRSAEEFDAYAAGSLAEQTALDGYEQTTQAASRSASRSQTAQDFARLNQLSSAQADYESSASTTVATSVANSTANYYAVYEGDSYMANYSSDYSELASQVNLDAEQTTRDTAYDGIDNAWIAETSTRNRDLSLTLSSAQHAAQVALGTAQVQTQSRVAQAALTEAANLVDDEADYANALAEAQQAYTLAMGAASANFQQGQLAAEAAAYGDLATSTQLVWAQFKADEANAKSAAFASVRSQYDANATAYAALERQLATELTTLYTTSMADVLSAEGARLTALESAATARVISDATANQQYADGVTNANWTYTQQSTPGTDLNTSYQDAVAAAGSEGYVPSAGEEYVSGTTSQHATYATALNTANDSFNTNVTSAHIAAVTAAAASTLNLSTTTASHTQQLANLQGTQQASLQLAEQQALASNLQSQSATSPYHQHASDEAAAKAQQLADSAAAQESHRETVTQAAVTQALAAAEAEKNYTISQVNQQTPMEESPAPLELPPLPEAPPAIAAPTKPEEYQEDDSPTLASAAFNSLSSMASNIWSMGSELFSQFSWGQNGQETTPVAAQDPNTEKNTAFDGVSTPAENPISVLVRGLDQWITGPAEMTIKSWNGPTITNVSPRGPVINTFVVSGFQADSTAEADGTLRKLESLVEQGRQILFEISALEQKRETSRRNEGNFIGIPPHWTESSRQSAIQAYDAQISALKHQLQDLESAFQQEGFDQYVYTGYGISYDDNPRIPQQSGTGFIGAIRAYHTALQRNGGGLQAAYPVETLMMAGAFLATPSAAMAIGAAGGGAVVGTHSALSGDSLEDTGSNALAGAIGGAFLGPVVGRFLQGYFALAEGVATGTATAGQEATFAAVSAILPSALFVPATWSAKQDLDDGKPFAAGFTAALTAMSWASFRSYAVSLLTPPPRTRVTFGHGARHLQGYDVSQSAVESTIAEMVRANPGAGSRWGWVNVDGHWIQYRAYVLSDGTVNIGTYFVVPNNISNARMP